MDTMMSYLRKTQRAHVNQHLGQSDRFRVLHGRTTQALDCLRQKHLNT